MPDSTAPPDVSNHSFTQSGDRQIMRKLIRPVLWASASLTLIGLTQTPWINRRGMTMPCPYTNHSLAQNCSSVLAQAPSSPIEVRAIASVGMTVSDMDQAVGFYEEVLDFTKISDVEVHGRPYELLQGVFGIRMRVVQMQLGDEVIELTDYLTVGGQPIPVDSRSNDLWFQHVAIVVSDMDAAYQRLRDFNVPHVSTAPQRLPETIPAAAGIEAFYFQDPDGHTLELIFFPPDKGDPRWQEPTDDLFLGIDHTAIGIADTETSRQFYEDLLGLEVAGNSMNFGPEQEHLNNVFGARLNITGLRAENGMGLEFLDYLSPATGRPYPPDSEAHDLWHWETTLEVDAVDDAAARLQASGVPFVSSGVVEIPGRSLGFTRGFLVRDPDGHVIRLIER
ncbi:MAG: VOC family protein [Leptolyngbyaceae bacterium]|nr:VOC family protein [Leptolyngbyaceae bacterium]